MDKEKEIKAYLDGELLPDTRMKYEIAEEMGLLDRVFRNVWADTPIIFENSCIE